MRSQRFVAAAVALAVAAWAEAAAEEPAVRPKCLAAGLSGKFFVARADGPSWTLMVDEHCGYTSLRFSGDPANDVVQPTKGKGRLAQVDARDVFILQSSEGEFADVLSVVRLGARTYLVPTNQHLRFCIEWAQGREPRKGPIGRFLMRAGDEGRPVSRRAAPAICEQQK
jgi:hypothetical protein